VRRYCDNNNYDDGTDLFFVACFTVIVPFHQYTTYVSSHLLSSPVLTDIDEEDDINHLNIEQYMSLANDEEIRRYLRDEKLQAVIRDIDSCDNNRKAALVEALKASNFKEFTDYILNVIHKT
jgi:hypothetical protein